MEIGVDLAAALLTRLFEHEHHYIDNREFRIPSRLRGWRDMLSPCLRRDIAPLMNSNLMFDWGELYLNVESFLKQKCLIPAPDSETVFPSQPQPLPFTSVLEQIPQTLRERVETYFARHYTLKELSIDRS